MVSIAQVEGGRIDPVLNNLINRVDNIATPKIEDLKDLLRKNAKVLEMRSGSDIVAHFFTDLQGDVLVLECMLGKAVNGVDPCEILVEYAEQEAKRVGVSRIQIHTKRTGVVRKFLNLGFDCVQFVIEKQIQ